jgi:DNA-binding LytR/AlgR family response regulator
MKVLIFEDQPLQRLELERKMQNQGYEVEGCSTPSEAIRLLREKQWFPDLALLDIELDVLSEDLIQSEESLGFPRKQAGIELAKQILKFRKSPIIFLTGYPGHFEEAKSLGPHSFLIKASEAINEQNVVNAIQLAFQNFYESPEYRPKFNLIPKGKICLNIRPQNRNQNEVNVFRKIVLPIEDIFYFQTQQEVTRLFVKGYEKALFPTVSATNIMKQLEELLYERNEEGTFCKLFNGCYANINRIVSYDSDNAYFEADSKIFCPLNSAGYQYLLTLFPPLTN